MRDGWHIISGRKVYIKNSIVKRGIIQRSALDIVPGYVYRRVGTGWGKEDHGVSVAAFRAGIKRGTIDIL